jgi:hypothetical protein
MTIVQKHKIIPHAIAEKERIEKYLQFVIFFNKFINHRKKLRRQFVEKDMRI